MALPSNISSWLKKNGSSEQQRAARQICKWCEDLGHRIVGGTAIGKYYDTLILDLTYNGSQIRVEDDGTIKMNYEVVRSKQDAKTQLDEIFNKKQASIFGEDGKHYNKQQVLNFAKNDVNQLSNDKQWVKHIVNDSYNAFKMHEGTELSEKEFDWYQNECIKLLEKQKKASRNHIARQLVIIAKELVAGGLGSEDEKKLKKDIEKAKKKIEQQVMRSGVKEDLGRKEVRELKDKYNYYNSNIGKLIKDFDNWIEEHIEMWIDGVR